ncbi:DUF3298 domain-containing protein [Halobacillus fulvus]|nr:DUF3298 domain-containing protein [Halobacillus fulvus]
MNRIFPVAMLKRIQQFRRKSFCIVPHYSTPLYPFISFYRITYERSKFKKMSGVSLVLKKWVKLKRMEGMLMKQILIIIISIFVMLASGMGVSAEQSSFQVKRKNHITQDWEVHVNYPEFDQLENEELQQQVNERIISKLDQQLKMVKRSANQVIGIPILYYEESSVVEEEGFYSVVMTSNISKGEQYNTTVTSINFDSKSIKRLEDFVYMDKLNQEIKRAIAQDPDTYFTEKFQEVRKDTAYYVKNEKLILVFNKYEVAAGVHGTPEVEVNLEDIKKEETPKAPLPRVT